MADHLRRDQQPATSRDFVPGVLLFLFALALRLVVQNDLSENPSYLYPLIDAGSHHNLALELQGSQTIPEGLFWRSVFYPLYLAATYFATGSSIFAAKLFQAFLGAATCLLTFHLGTRTFGRPCGAVAGIITALYGPLIFWESELLAVGWAAFWCVTLLWVALKAADTRAAWLHFAFGLVGGLAVLTRPSFLPFVLGTLAWLAWSARAESGGKALSRLAVAVLGFGVLTLPTALTSRAVAEHASFLPKAGAVNLYIGNHPDRCQMLTKRPGDEWLELREVVQNSEAGGTGAFRKRVVDHARAHPMDFARGLLHKLGQLANGREIPRNVDIYLFDQWSPLLGTLVWKLGSFGFPFGVLFPLAGVGLVLRWRAIPAPLLLLIATYPLVIAATFVAGRYRAPIVPALAILAGAGVVELLARLRGRRWREASLPLALGAALLVLTHRAEPYCEESGSFHSEMYVFIAIDAAAAGETQLALDLFEKAVQIDPESPRAHEELAQHHAGQGELDLALTHYGRSIALSDSYWVRRARGGVHFARGDLELALADFSRSIAVHPTYSLAYLGRGAVYLQMGDREKGRADVARALEYASSQPEAEAAFQTLEQIDRRRP